MKRFNSVTMWVDRYYAIVVLGLLVRHLTNDGRGTVTAQLSH